MDFTKCTDPTTATPLYCIIPLFQNIISAAFLFVGTVALFMIIYGGIRFIISRGDQKQIEGAKSILTWGIIGLVLVLFSFFIIRIIAFVTGTEQVVFPRLILPGP